METFKMMCTITFRPGSISSKIKLCFPEDDDVNEILKRQNDSSCPPILLLSNYHQSYIQYCTQVRTAFAHWQRSFFAMERKRAKAKSWSYQLLTNDIMHRHSHFFQNLRTLEKVAQSRRTRYESVHGVPKYAYEPRSKPSFSNAR